MAEQVVKMVIKVNLQCGRCYKKIKKILYEIPQVKDQCFDEKQNKVTITVVCCSPEEVRQKICCKGGEIILGIDIIPPNQKTGKKDGSTQTQEQSKKDESTQTQEPSKKDESTQTQKLGPPPVAPCTKRVPSPPVVGYPPVYVMGGLYVCVPCHDRGCGWFCPCNCHYGRPPMCHDGCGRPAHECRCRRPPPMCHDGCGRPAHECTCRRSPMCYDGCGRPAHECGCWRPSYPRCCDRCNDENASSSWTLHSCDCGRPPVCTNAGYECESSCSHM